MKTLVSRLSVACHQRSGKYRTCRRCQWGAMALPGHPGVPCSPWTHLPRAQGALQRPLGCRQGGIRVLEPGQRRLVGVEVRGFIRRVQEPALENTGGTSPPNSPPAPRAQPHGAFPCPGTPVRGACFSPSSPNRSPRAQFSPSCRKSPRRNQGRASGREHRSPSLRWEQGVGAGESPPVPAQSHPTPTCDPKAVGGAGARDAEGRGHVVLEKGAPLGEVVVPEEVERVWGDTGG